MTFNWGALLGWTAVNGTLLTDASLPCAAIPLYLAGVGWTLVYDTIYAHQDKLDDKLVGVKSTALLFGDQSSAILSGFGGVTILGLTMAGYQLHMPWPYYIFGIGGTSMHLIWQLRNTSWNDRTECARKFAANSHIGWIVLSGILASYFWNGNKIGKGHEKMEETSEI